MPGVILSLLMGFSAPASQYDRYMGRYTPSLALALADAVPIDGDMKVLDVGCGPGGLTGELVRRVGSENVAAVDPAFQFVEACRSRSPGADVKVGVAEELPWADGTFDASLSCLVLAFMQDPAKGLAEMKRVTRPGGSVALCMWDTATEGMKMLHVFWSAAKPLDPSLRGERDLPGGQEGDIQDRLRHAGFEDVTGGELMATARYAGFGDFWEPFTFSIGPAGRYLASLPEAEQEQVREACRELVPAEPFSLDARAWFGRGRVPG